VKAAWHSGQRARSESRIHSGGALSSSRLLWELMCLGGALRLTRCQDEQCSSVTTSETQMLGTHFQSAPELKLRNVVFVVFFLKLAMTALHEQCWRPGAPRYFHATRLSEKLAEDSKTSASMVFASHAVRTGCLERAIEIWELPCKPGACVHRDFHWRRPIFYQTCQRQGVRDPWERLHHFKRMNVLQSNMGS